LDSLDLIGFTWTNSNSLYVGMNVTIRSWNRF
jgi:hypothetical protein